MAYPLNAAPVTRTVTTKKFLPSNSFGPIIKRPSNPTLTHAPVLAFRTQGRSGETHKFWITMMRDQPPGSGGGAVVPTTGQVWPR